MTEELRGIVSSVSKAATDLNRLVRSLRRIETLDRTRSQNAIELGNLVKNLDQQVERASLPPNLRQELRTWLDSFRPQIQRAIDQLHQRFGVELERLLAEQGWKLHGHVPDLRVSFYTLEVDEAKAEVQIWFGPKQEPLARARLVPQEVVKRLLQVDKDLVERPLDEQQFIKNLFSAYEMVLLRLNLRPGDRAPIVDVLMHLSLLLQDRKFQADPRREHFRGYSRAHFAYDLYRLRQRRLLDQELVLGTATRAYTGNRRDFIWVPSDQSGNGTVYAHVIFRQAGPKEAL